MKFVVNDEDHKKYILASLGKWRDNLTLFNIYYSLSLSVDKDHWAMFLECRLHPDTMVKTIN